MKRIPKYGNIMYGNLHPAFNKIREFRNHASLESDRVITQTDRPPPQSLGIKWIDKGSLLLIVKGNRD